MNISIFLNPCFSTCPVSIIQIQYTTKKSNQYLKFPANVNNYQVNVPDKYVPTTWTLYPGMVGRIMARLVFPQALGNAAQTNFSSPVFSLVNPII